MASTRPQFIQTSLLPTHVEPRFGGHEGYSPRLRWLIKGMDAIAQHSGYFQNEDACLKLGMSSRMAKSLLFWCEAFKLVAPIDNKRQGFRVSRLGQQIRQSDPYLEAAETLWILQDSLLSPPCAARCWEWFSHRFYTQEFNQEFAHQQWQEYADAQGLKVAHSTLRTDLNCLFKMYVPNPRSNFEEQLDHPFTALRILQVSPELGIEGGGTTLIRTTSKVSAELLTYLCIQHLLRFPHLRAGCTVALKELLWGNHCPNLLLRMSQYHFEDLLIQGCNLVEGLAVPEAANLICLSWTRPLEAIAQDLWNRIYPANCFCPC